MASLRRISLRATVIAVFIAFLGLFSWAWRTQISQPVTCSAESLDEPVSMVGLNYAELRLTEQHPIEPFFSGVLFIGLLKGRAISVTPLVIERSAGRDYMTSTIESDLVPTAGGIYLKRPEPIDLITEAINAVRITNRVPGFTLSCKTVEFVRTDAGKRLTVRFTLSRAPLIQLAAIALALASLVFLIVILLTESRETLPTSVASFFFSLWSIRAIMQTEMRVFPTLLDSWILALSVAMLLGLCARVLATRTRK
jgi:hypothetical protein